MSVCMTIDRSEQFFELINLKVTDDIILKQFSATIVNVVSDQYYKNSVMSRLRPLLPFLPPFLPPFLLPFLPPFFSPSATLSSMRQQAACSPAAFLTSRYLPRMLFSPVSDIVLKAL